MMEHSLEARVIDSHHLKLRKPIQIPPGSTIMITIEPGEIIAEDLAWYTLSAQSLEAAYSQDEPEYSLDRIKIPNPEYQP